MELNKQNIKKILFIITVAIILLVGLQNLGAVGKGLSFLFQLISPFLIGLVIALILNVPMNFIENKLWVSKKEARKKRVGRGKRIVSLSLSILMIVGIIFLLLFLVIPELVKTFTLFAEQVPSLISNLQHWVETMTSNYPEVNEWIGSLHFDWNVINDQLIQFLQNGVTGALTSSVNFMMSIITSIVNFTIGIVFAIYILVQKEKLAGQLKKLTYAYCNEKRAKKIVHVAEVANKIFGGFIAGQFTEAIVIGILCFIGMLILGIPYPLTISVLVGFTALIPVIGAFLGTAIGVLLIIVSSPIKAILFVIYIIILQQIEGNIIYPKVVGNSVGLPPIWVLVAITIGGSLMGLVGMIISVPISSVLYALIREDASDRLEKKKIEAT